MAFSVLKRLTHGLVFVEKIGLETKAHTRLFVEKKLGGNKSAHRPILM
jgi:hypothetical protein